ncbi:helix-turn-helix transcriptional regulator [Altererythrobacter fulvus]|uniref:helix-turn-helix domain-containing protein n=1 Tax=Caenibius fulvus TaxID=2126012 RepID=UPI003017A97E
MIHEVLEDEDNSGPAEHAMCSSEPGSGARGEMSAKQTIRRWRKDPAFREAYMALAEEFALALQVVEARSRAGLTQEELAERMGTSRSAIARLESGTARPSVTTLEKLARATGSRLRIELEG